MMGFSGGGLSLHGGGLFGGKAAGGFGVFSLGFEFLGRVWALCLVHSLIFRVLGFCPF